MSMRDRYHGMNNEVEDSKVIQEIESAANPSDVKIEMRHSSHRG